MRIYLTGWWTYFLAENAPKTVGNKYDRTLFLALLNLRPKSLHSILTVSMSWRQFAKLLRRSIEWLTFLSFEMIDSQSVVEASYSKIRIRAFGISLGKIVWGHRVVWFFNFHVSPLSGLRPWTNTILSMMRKNHSGNEHCARSTYSTAASCTVWITLVPGGKPPFAVWVTRASCGWADLKAESEIPVRESVDRLLGKQHSILKELWKETKSVEGWFLLFESESGL